MNIRSFKSTAFAPINPNRTRISGYEYHAFPVDKDDGSPNTPLIEAEAFESVFGTSTLCGLSEYTTPSVPPKKFLEQVLSGASVVCAIPAPGPIPATYEVRSYSGQYEYDPETCTPTNNQLREDRNQVGGVCGGTPAVTGSAVPSLSPWFSDYAVPSAWSRVTTPTTDTYTGISGFVAFFCQSTSGVSVATLTNEDTEDTAIARTTPSGSGTAAISYRETRGAADFTFLWQNSTFEGTAGNLVIGSNYQVALPILTENYGGGSPVLSEILLAFTAVAATYSITIPIPCAPGKQVTASSPSISFA